MAIAVRRTLKLGDAVDVAARLAAPRPPLQLVLVLRGGGPAR